MPLAAHAVQNGIDGLIGQGVHPAELGMEIGGILRDVGQGIIDLIIAHHILGADVLQGNAAALSEGHLPVAVVGDPRIDADCQRRQLGGMVPCRGEKVSHRAFHGRRLLPVPVKADDRVAPLAGRHHPDMLHHARPLYVGKLPGLPRPNDHIGVHLPALSQIPGRMPGAALLQLAPGSHPFLPRGVLCTDRPAAGRGQTGQVRHAANDSVKSHLLMAPFFSVNRKADQLHSPACLST